LPGPRASGTALMCRLLGGRLGFSLRPRLGFSLGLSLGLRFGLRFGSGVGPLGCNPSGRKLGLLFFSDQRPELGSLRRDRVGL